MADKKKPNYRFYNPNPLAITADFVLDIFLAVNKYELDQALRNATSNCRLELHHSSNKTDTARSI